MDPVSLGVAAAGLAATKFGEQFAQDAGDTAWHAVRRLRKPVADRFRHEPETCSAISALAQAPAPEAQTVVARRIAESVEQDPVFATRLDELVTAAHRDRGIEVLVVQAFDAVRQVNIHGDDTGMINIA